jgi:hypothetical protein
MNIVSYKKETLDKEQADKLKLCNAQRNLDSIIKESADRDIYNRLIAPVINDLCGNDFSRMADSLYAIGDYLRKGYPIANVSGMLEDPEYALEMLQAKRADIKTRIKQRKVSFESLYLKEMAALRVELSSQNAKREEFEELVALPSI